MKLSHEQVKHIAKLAQLGLNEAEVEKLSSQLSDILENFEILKQIDTSNMPAATHSIPLQNIFREDTVTKSYPQSEVLANAPRQEDSCFRVPTILE